MDEVRRRGDTDFCLRLVVNQSLSRLSALTFRTRREREEKPLLGQAREPPLATAGGLLAPVARHLMTTHPD